MMEVSENFVILMMVSVALLLVGWTLVYILRNTVIGSQTQLLLLPSPMPLDGPNKQVITTTNMPNLMGGNTFTYHFWMRIDGYSFTQHSHKIMWYRSRGSDDVTGSPVVMMDANSNVIYILLPTNDTLKGTTINQIIGKSVDALRKEMRFAVAIIDYFPMTRWVHLGIIVNDRYVTLTLDGQLFSNGTVDTYAGTAANARRPYITAPEGQIYVGGQPAVQGKITRLAFCNYPMLQADLQKVYEAGVTGQSILSSVGLPIWGLRNPFYRIS
jgi:hypothetical protein